jgi:hypothetical protein
MRRIAAQRGEGNLGCILWALVVIVVAHVAWMMVPVKIANAQLADFMEDQARFAERRTPEQIGKGILAKARELEIPLDPKKVDVQRRGDHIYMKAEYVQPVRFFGGYTYEWHFLLDVDRPIFIF